MRSFITLVIVAGLGISGISALFGTLSSDAYCNAVSEAKAEVATCK